MVRRCGDDFGPDSDIDLLYTYAPDSNMGLFEHAQMERELSELLGRKVDMISRQAVEQSSNRLRRRDILRNKETVYVSG
ncbi:MAG: nucleotidyltransferase domain-containing protein [Candidatus Hatepunaea meridiana]|nr:nucleotidyltransferase domain-containing protein [Candidatus Hatepunaea meridiana]